VSTPSRSPYLFAFAIAALSTAICFLMFPFFELTNLVMMYLLGTLLVAARGTRGSAALFSAVSVVCFDFFFVPPRFMFSVADVEYLFTFAVMFIAGMTISYLTVRLRSEAEAAREGEIRTGMMHAFGQELSTTRGVKEALQAAVGYMGETFKSGVAAFVSEREGQLKVASHSEGMSVREKDEAVAEWCYKQGMPAGPGTSSLPDSEALFVPLKGNQRCLGVLMIKSLAGPLVPLKTNQRQLLDSFAHQLALALEVDRLQETAQKAELEAETERLRSSLLSSVSHDFRTPLTAIVGSASTLLGRDEIKKSKPALELTETIQAEGERLARLVQNLLESTRLESGAVKINKELYPLEEVLGTALERLEKSLKNREIKVEIPDEFPMVPLDSLLMGQVFLNLLENAVRYTPPNSPIEISAEQS